MKTHPTWQNRLKQAFSHNPINLKPSQKTSTTLTITVLDDAQLGTYTLMVELGEWKVTGIGALFCI